MIDLHGRVALVTGGSRGIGKACALRLAEAGADVIVNYISSETGADDTARAVQSMGRRVATVKADVSEKEDVESMIEFIGREFGQLDILVSNSASGGFRPMLMTTEAQFGAAMNINARALLWLVQAGMPLLRRSKVTAKVIALSSRGADAALPFYGVVGASKAALESLVRQFALELGGSRINFNVVQAGLTDTDSTRALQKFWALQNPQGAKLAMPAALQPQDVASAVLFLASSLSDGVQGQTLVVDDCAVGSSIMRSSIDFPSEGTHQ